MDTPLLHLPYLTLPVRQDSLNTPRYFAVADCRRDAIHREREAHSSRLGRQEHPRCRRPTLGKDRRLRTVAHHRGGVLHDEYR